MPSSLDAKKYSLNYETEPSELDLQKHKTVPEDDCKISIITL